MITDNKQQSRFELRVEGELAYADYQRATGTVTITHVFTPPALRGGGVASQLMAEIAANARSEGLKISPVCSYAAAWMKRHSEYSDLL